MRERLGDGCRRAGKREWARRFAAVSRFIGALALCIILAGCSGGTGKAEGAKGGAASGGRQRQPFAVEVQPVATRRVEYAVTAVGSVEAFEVVQVTARVPGAVERIHFAEGDVVRKEDVLVEIEPERYRLEVAAAGAALEKAQAAHSEAEAGLARREGAVERNPGLIPTEEIETWRTRVRTATAEVASERAALERAEMNARDAAARAPFAGTIQTRDVKTGQYVQPGALLATLVRRDPLLLRFKVPEQDAPRLETGMAARFTVRGSERQFSARLTSVAEAASEESRMVAVTAAVDDRDKEALRPGAFAEVVVPIGASVDAPVIPQTAVRPSERGFLAYVVSGGAAAERILTLGLRTEDGLVEVRSGLSPGDSLVVRGAEALSDGAPVRVSEGVDAKGSAGDGAAAESAAADKGSR